jgi:hypothetical protein
VFEPTEIDDIRKRKISRPTIDSARALTVIPTFVLLDVIREHRIQYVRRIAANFGIKRVVKIYFK